MALCEFCSRLSFVQNNFTLLSIHQFPIQSFVNSANLDSKAEFVQLSALVSKDGPDA